MPDAPAAKQPPPPPDLVRGEAPYWKMADLKGLVLRHLVTGYLVTNFRCFIWDVERNVVTANVPIELADVAVEGRRKGRRSKRGGSFIVPQTVNYAQPTMGEPVEVKALIDALKAHARSHMRAPRGLGVDALWSEGGPAAGERT
jgi:hypothetical protein